MSSAKSRPFCLGFNVLSFRVDNLYTNISTDNCGGHHFSAYEYTGLYFIGRNWLVGTNCPFDRHWIVTDKTKIQGSDFVSEGCKLCLSGTARILMLAGVWETQAPAV